ncbi:MAG: 50S ribosomal protein L18 [Candidatus Omnitrophica bacterium]|nr:50S ribosomal protein L18 [Candidatus Omnitrophota bacterium]
MLETIQSAKEYGRVRRHLRIRKRLQGTPERPRLVIHRSHLHLYAQLVDDAAQKTLLTLGTTSPHFQAKSKKGGNVEAAEILGELVAKTAAAKGIKQVAFDRGGYLYHGRVKAFAQAARQHGLDF